MSASVPAYPVATFAYASSSVTVTGTASPARAEAGVPDAAQVAADAGPTSIRAWVKSVGSAWSTAVISREPAVTRRTLAEETPLENAPLAGNEPARSVLLRVRVSAKSVATLAYAS